MTCRAELTQPLERLRVVIRGAVQGVGFRPFLYNLASELRLKGGVRNCAEGVWIEVEGEREAVNGFRLRLEAERPPRSFIQSLEAVHLDPLGYEDFQIWPSDQAGTNVSVVLPDIATCPDCRRELLDPRNRRFGYPFTNCVNCGPRFSIIEAMPYDRARTSMKAFEMCEQCQAEYENPRDRRFHAQPNACPVCGPQVELLDQTGRVLQIRQQAMARAAEALTDGAIVAVKGLGGFHLLVAARDDRAVQRLRELKHREQKPFAVMLPSLAAAAEQCEVGELEARVLLSPEAPIVLLRRYRSTPAGSRYSVSERVAPGNPYLGVMLPYTPLHLLLLARLDGGVVATSGNLAEEPICIDEHEARERLGGIADYFLVHNRPIVRHVDDSIVRIALGRELVLRRARGYAPLPVPSPVDLPPTLAVGAHLKNTIALGSGHQVVLSQHIGDLETAPALAAFQRVIGDFQQLHRLEPVLVAADSHPDYLSTQQAHATGKPVTQVQHHYAHVLACMAENELGAPVLGVAWDGTGYGEDGTIWGGEFLKISETGFERVGHLRTFPLPGGEKAVQEPRRAALGLLYELFGSDVFAMADLASLQAFAPAELQTLQGMLATQLNCPRTSSAGRLIDAVASVGGLRQQVRFEGQAAMDLEFAVEEDDSEADYPFHLQNRPPALVVDWEPTMHNILDDLRAGVPVWEVSARFHNTLAEYVVAVARKVGETRVVLTGGCFQNKYLLERTVRRLRIEGFSAYWHQRVPPNDGGIALGQVFGAARRRCPKR